MSKHEPKNKKLDRVGRRVLEAAKLPAVEIDKIVGAPHLFESVKSRIAQEEQSRGKRELYFGVRTSFFLWGPKSMTGAFAAVALLITAFAITAVIFISGGAPQIAKQVPVVNEFQTPVQPFENQPKHEVAAQVLPAGLPVSDLKPRKVTADRTDFKNQTPKAEKTVVKKNPAKQQQRRKSPVPKTEEAEGEFYPLTYSRNFGEGEEDLRVVRTELSASALFALGIDVPIENAISKVKTDLLVGRDGAPKAIRFVK